MSPVRIQLRRTKGWRMPDNTVKVDRRTRWGNPFNLQHSDYCWTAIAHGFKGDGRGRQAASVAMFAAWLIKGEPFTVTACGLYVNHGGAKHLVATSPDIAAPAPPSQDDIRQELRGKNLACWCKPDAPCHADVLLEIANRSREDAA